MSGFENVRAWRDYFLQFRIKATSTCVKLSGVNHSHRCILSSTCWKLGRGARRKRRKVRSQRSYRDTCASTALSRDSGKFWITAASGPFSLVPHTTAGMFCQCNYSRPRCATRKWKSSRPIASRSHSQVLTRPPPATVMRSRRWVRFTALQPVALTQVTAHKGTISKNTFHRRGRHHIGIASILGHLFWRGGGLQTATLI